MVERLKRWESPRKRGRNDKGKGGSARARQLRKREQMMRQKLQKGQNSKPQKQITTRKKEQDLSSSLFFMETKLVFLQSTFAVNKYSDLI